jgi:hypothetical protein
VWGAERELRSAGRRQKQSFNACRLQSRSKILGHIYLKESNFNDSIRAAAVDLMKSPTVIFKDDAW